MGIAFETKEGVQAIRLATHDTASMLLGHVEVELMNIDAGDERP